MYYRRRERHWRVAVFFAGAALAGSLGGILAVCRVTRRETDASVRHRQDSGRRSAAVGVDLCRKLRFGLARLTVQIEGIVTVLVGLSAFWWVPGYVEDAKFLNDRERAIVIGRLQSDTDGGDHEPFNWAGVWAAFKDPFVWVRRLRGDAASDPRRATAGCSTLSPSRYTACRFLFRLL